MEFGRGIKFKNNSSGPEAGGTGYNAVKGGPGGGNNGVAGGAGTSPGGGGGTQTSGGTSSSVVGVFGYAGSNNSDGGGGGGGWYGGGTGISGGTDSGGGGGSGFVWKAGASVPGSYAVQTNYQLTDAFTKAGDDNSIPTQNGTSTMTGNTGNGYGKITWVSP